MIWHLSFIISLLARDWLVNWFVLVLSFYITEMRSDLVRQFDQSRQSRHDEHAQHWNAYWHWWHHWLKWHPWRRSQMTSVNSLICVTGVTDVTEVSAVTNVTLVTLGVLRYSLAIHHKYIMQHPIYRVLRTYLIELHARIYQLSQSGDGIYFICSNHWWEELVLSILIEHIITQ